MKIFADSDRQPASIVPLVALFLGSIVFADQRPSTETPVADDVERSNVVGVGSEIEAPPPNKSKDAIATKKKEKADRLAKIDGKEKNDKEAGAARVLYANDAYTLTAHSITEGSRRAEATAGSRPHLINCNAEMVRPSLKRSYPTVQTNNPLVDMLYQVALADLEMNIVEDARGTYFRVSPDFPNAIFTRDTAYSSELGAAFVVPDVIKSHLRIDRGLRRQLEFRCPEGESIPLEGVVNQPEPLGSFEFFEKYGTNAYARRTDDPCWVLGYWMAICAAGGPDEMQWLIDEFRYFDEHFYRHFFDRSDGLYFGQASFIDIGGTGYPPEYTLQDCLRIKALSTNCLYVAAFRQVAKACERLGQMAMAVEYRRRAAQLSDRILSEFRHPTGYLAYYKDMNGMLQPRREQLGMAFCVLFDVVPQEDFGIAVDDYPFNDFGGPTFFPFFEGKKVYHNHALWPFADTYFQMALQKRFQGQSLNDELVSRTLGNLCRHALWGNFAEMLDYETGGWKVKHARSYIWSASAYLGAIFRMLAGIDIADGRNIRFHPYLPESFGSKLVIKHLVIQGMHLTVDIAGHGNRIHECLIDGIPSSTAELAVDGREHQISISLSPGDAADGSPQTRLSPAKEASRE